MTTNTDKHYGHLGYIVVCDAPKIKLHDAALGLWPVPGHERALLVCKHITFFQSQEDAEEAIRVTAEIAKAEQWPWLTKGTAWTIRRVYPMDGRPELDLPGLQEE